MSRPPALQTIHLDDIAEADFVRLDADEAKKLFLAGVDSLDVPKPGEIVPDNKRKR
jgi:hypothetical protein